MKNPHPQISPHATHPSALALHFGAVECRMGVFWYRGRAVFNGVFKNGARTVRRNKGRAAAAAWLFVILLLTGCSATDGPTYPSNGTSPAVSIVVPAEGRTLRDYGLSHAPVGFSVPRDLNPNFAINQENLIALDLNPVDGAATLTYLTERLGTMGFEIVESGGGSLIFRDAHWDGSFTTGDSSASLTLRLVR